jgi:hypothetical protein
VRQFLPDCGVIRCDRNDAPAQFDDGGLVLRFFRGRELFSQLCDIASRTLQGLKCDKRNRQINYQQTK